MNYYSMDKQYTTLENFKERLSHSKLSQSYKDILIANYNNDGTKPQDAWLVNAVRNIKTEAKELKSINDSPIDLTNSTKPIDGISAIFCHFCCGSGFGYIKEWRRNNPNITLKSYSYLNVHELKLHEKYGFDLESLRDFCYIIVNDNNIITVLKGPNK